MGIMGLLLLLFLGFLIRDGYHGKIIIIIIILGFLIHNGYHGKIIFCWVITWDNALGEMEGAVLKAGPTLDCHLLKQGPSL
jgi:hypothetical protein